MLIIIVLNFNLAYREKDKKKIILMELYLLVIILGGISKYNTWGRNLVR